MFDGPSPFVLGLAPGQTPWHSVSQPPMSQAGGSNGNATIDTRYKVTDLECTYNGRYVVGSTTSWNAGVFTVWLPMALATDSIAFAPYGFVEAFDSSRNEHWTGQATSIGTGAQTGLAVFQHAARQVSTGGIMMPGAAWNVQATPNNYPFTSNEQWATSDDVKWSLHFPVSPL
jgi:hypothetical protein